MTATYTDLGVRRVINANATLTALGGSLMPQPVLEAMRAASTSFVDMFELQRAVSARLAQLTRNEAALVTCGASAGLLVAALGAMTGRDHLLLGRLLEHGARALPRHRIVMHRAHRIPYDNVFTLAGMQIVEIGNAIQTHRWELEAALDDSIAAVVHVAGAHLANAALTLDEVVQVAHGRAVPVIVDAAAQLPPRENLWRFTEQGADLVVFSGGKELRGPQASGLVLGSQEAVSWCELHAAPHQRFGRPAKVGKEELMGLLAAVELWLEQDHEAVAARIEQTTMAWVKAFSELPGAVPTYEPCGEAGRPLPRMRLAWPAQLGFTSTQMIEALAADEPVVEVAAAGTHAIWISAELLTPEEEQIVAERVYAAYAALARRFGRNS